ncbi:MFS transporter [Isoptericola cucumis]|uniref:MFS transporter n=1 Tax=Isoptericola cucumis TaxID=1776856 RepID=A0ABQ2BD57_9MICO|nr:MFS transporter [Isoptericola cucumis]GGI11035.1 MFS transporter [Isoptericola cucumis]
MTTNPTETTSTTSTTTGAAAGRAAPLSPRRAWLALATMFLGSFSLVTAEFLPPGVLTPVAHDLGVTEGVVGLSVSVTALTALLTALGLSSMFPRTDRRTLLVVLALGAVVSNVLVAVAPSIGVLMVARLLLGAALGGYWSMSLVIAARLVAADRVGRAMMIVNAGTTVATVAGVPLGVLISAAAGWRVVFWSAAALTVVTAVAMRLALPLIAPTPGIGWSAMGRALRSPGVAVGVVSIVAVIGGHFVGFTYVRPALSLLPGSDVGTIAVLLALFGVGGLVGNFAIGALVDRHLPVLLLAVPVAIGVSVAAVGLAAFAPVLAYPAVVVWGAAFGGVLNVVQVWITRVLPDQVEAGSGLVVAGFQTAIILGSAVGGVGVDAVGVGWAYLVAAVVAVAGGILVRSTLTRASARAAR